MTNLSVCSWVTVIQVLQARWEGYEGAEIFLERAVKGSIPSKTPELRHPS